MARNKQNTPGIIKYPFWQMTYQNPKAVYACVNLGDGSAERDCGTYSLYRWGYWGGAVCSRKMNGSNLEYIVFYRQNSFKKLKKI